ncbi:MAG: glycosyltransferase family 2 protein [Marinibacterium sp.]|nr:glycosyltransferase family 2 protein [Marinibacterium sp.]
MGHRPDRTRLSRCAPDRHEGDDGLRQARWGTVTTVKAPDRAILGFAAHHLWLGAHRVVLYLDAPETLGEAAAACLEHHPRIRLIRCTDAWWNRRGGRPLAHQRRQSRNATHAYGRGHRLDWLAHIDVDEFLWPQDPDGSTVAGALAALPAQTLCARIRPDEMLAGDGTAFKRHMPPGPGRARVARALYGPYARGLRAGFLSHVAGKLFLRTGHARARLRIHTARIGDVTNPGQADLPALALLHAHAPDWASWQQAFDRRLDRGSYRAALPGHGGRGVALHDMLQAIRARDGTAGLRDFFDRVCADTPDLRCALDRHGLLRQADLALDARILRIFGKEAPGHIA